MSSSNLKNRHTFNSNERIKSKKLAEDLFNKGSSFFIYPFIVRVLTHDESVDDARLKVLFAVPKKKVRLAASRNLIRRRIKESFRQRKTNVLNELTLIDQKILISLVYVAKEPKDYFFIDEKIAEILGEIPKRL